MEQHVNRIVEETMTHPGVSGVLCVDEKGLCLSGRGTMKNDTAGWISGVAQQSAKLHPDIDRAPVIVIESDAGNILIKSKEQVAVAVHKKLS